MPRVAVSIPARWGSTRFPGKPLHLIAGKPMVQHVWERCRLAAGVAEAIVATDDPRIADAARLFGAEVEMTRSSHVSGTDRCAEVAARRADVSHVINVQGDEPLVDPELVSRLAGCLLADAGIEMITAAHVIQDEAEIGNPNVVKVVFDRDGDALYFSRSAIPFVRGGGTVYRHLGIYGYSAGFLRRFVEWQPGVLEQAEQLEQLRALENGGRIRVVLTKGGSFGVDTLEDVAVVERIFGPQREA